MDEAVFVEILRNISLIAIITGVLTGLDLVSGARVISAFNRISNKRISLDPIINNARMRVGLGIIFLIVCSSSLLVVLTTR